MHARGARSICTRRLSRVAAASLTVLLLGAGCAQLGYLQHPRVVARSVAEQGGMRFEQVDAGRFVLSTFHRGLERASGTLVVYIEGDGRAWVRRNRLSRDPTPRDPVALRLAVRDPSPSVLYVARPCQYTDPESRRGCDPKYWSTHRYADQVVASVNAAIEHALARIGQKRSGSAPALGLVGYSGGGSVAALVAARRADVRWLVTVAANLDHAAWTRLHGVTPLRGSLNAADFAGRLASIPQLHLVGAGDETVPGSIADAFLRGLGEGAPARLAVIRGHDHRCCWVAEWPELLCRHQFWGLSACVAGGRSGSES